MSLEFGQMTTLGQELREERERRAISIKDIADQTKISVRLLLALESDRWDELPGSFFLKGVVKSYVQAIGADPEVFLKKLENQRERKTEAAGNKAGGVMKKNIPNKPPPEEFDLSDFSSKRRLPRIFRLSAAVLVVAAAAYFVIRWITPGSPPAVDRSKAAAPPPANVAPALPEDSKPKPETAEAGLRLEFRFRANSWMHVTADGSIVLDGVRPAGTTAVLEAKNEFLIHTGNAGGFDWLVNGRAARSLGGPGAVRTDIRINPANWESFLGAERAADPDGSPF